MKDRREILLQGIDVRRSLGLEIGAQCRPLVRPSDGPVIYSDYQSTAELRERFANDPGVKLDELVEVSVVCNAGGLTEAFRERTKVDYVIHSHVIEHVPNLVLWLRDHRGCIAEDGRVRMAIPDGRHTFDYLRTPSRTGDVVVAWMQNATRPLPHLVFDCMFNMVRVETPETWKSPIPREKLERYDAPQYVMDVTRMVAESGHYADVHSWVFTPLSFATLMEDLALLKLVEWRPEFVVETRHNEHEFFVGLLPCDDHELVRRQWQQWRLRLTP